MTNNRRPKRGRRSKRPLVIAGLALFVALDVGLVALALSDGVAGRSASGDFTAPSVLSTPSASAAAPRPSASSAPESPLPPSPSVFLSAVSESVAYRTTAGSCATGADAVLEKTTDAGASWVATSTQTGLAVPLRIQAVDESYVYLVGLSSGTCEPGFIATYTSGEDIQSYPDRLLGTWFLNPSSGTFHAPGRDIAAPCSAPQSLSVRTDLSALVLCRDTSVYETQDGGDSWVAVPEAFGAMAVTASSGGGMLIASLDPACSGVSISRVDATGVKSAVGCNASASASTSDLAISASGPTVWMQDGDAAFVSVDAGATWG
jgi:hypothetical protein